MNKQYFNALGVLKPKFHLNKHAKSNIGIKSIEGLGRILPFQGSVAENKTSGSQQNNAENFYTSKNLSQIGGNSTSCDVKTSTFDLNYYEVPEFYRKSPSEFVE